MSALSVFAMSSDPSLHGLASAPRLVALNPASLADIWDDFRRVGEAVGVDAEPVIRELQSRMTPVRST